MPDITMCSNTKCELRKNCYRYLAYSSKYRQSYFLTMSPKDGKCEQLWDTTNRINKDTRSVQEADRDNKEDFNFKPIR